MRVEQTEVINNDWHRKVERQYSEQGTHRPHQHSKVGTWWQVAVADRRHGNDRPPQSEWNRRKSVVGGLLQSLGVVDERCKYDESDDKKEHEQTKLVSARTERLDEDLEYT